MKKLTLTLGLIVLSVLGLWAQEYQVITTVESVVPAGLGRSRIIENKEVVNVAEVTTERVDGKKSNQGDIKRKEIKVDNFNESKLLNFYSAVGINFQNIASNDAMITSKLNQMAAEGWELAFVLSGVEGDAGETDGHGIFITRYVFKR